MRRVNVAGLLIVAGLVVVAALAACGSSPTQVPSAPTAPASPPTLAPTAAPALDGATLLETRCSVCHSADRPKNARLTKDQWEQTVALMITKGAKLTDAEKSVLVEYLAKTYGP